MKNKINAKKSMLVLLPVFVLVLVGVIGAVRTNAAQTQAAEVLYGVVTDINGSAYTLALGERTQSTVVSSSMPAQGEPPRQENSEEQLTRPQGETAQQGVQEAEEIPENISSTSAIDEQSGETFLYKNNAVTLVRTGVTTTLHIAENTTVVMCINTAMVETDVQRIAVGHVVKLYMDAQGGVQRVEIIE